MSFQKAFLKHWFDYISCLTFSFEEKNVILWNLKARSGFSLFENVADESSELWATKAKQQAKSS